MIPCKWSCNRYRCYFSGDAGGDTITAAILNGTVYGGNSTGTFADSNTDGNDSIAISSALNKSLLQGNGGADTVSFTTS